MIRVIRLERQVAPEEREKKVIEAEEEEEHKDRAKSERGARVR